MTIGGPNVIIVGASRSCESATELRSQSIMM